MHPFEGPVVPPVKISIEMWLGDGRPLTGPKFSKPHLYADFYRRHYGAFERVHDQP